MPIYFLEVKGPWLLALKKRIPDMSNCPPSGMLNWLRSAAALDTVDVEGLDCFAVFSISSKFSGRPFRRFSPILYRSVIKINDARLLIETTMHAN